ncbi:hypothetical protein RPE78_02230 [Thioclava litoralis]|uniref:Uncharacterized protein n=1 Tax=Thioclava litoralis TaxID=3076557 RepID=A0ABZ1DZA4_9RHOB|nr:hypothetical protein RPE78_02230 [Thioclava sp. FTW29]
MTGKSALLAMACPTMLRCVTNGRSKEAALQRSQLGECPERAEDVDTVVRPS